MIAGAVFAALISSPFAAPIGQQAQPIGDSMRRATDEAAKFYDRQWQLEGEALKVTLIEPEKKLRFSASYTKETVNFIYAGQNNGSKLEMSIIDPTTQKVVENTESDSLGSIYFMPKKGKTYTVEILNKGTASDFVTLIQTIGGLGTALPLSKIKFLASSQGHALWDMAKAGDITFPVNTPFLRAAVVPARGAFSASVTHEAPKTTVVGYGEEETLRVKAAIFDPATKKSKPLMDDGSGARFLQFPNGTAKGSKIQLTNPLKKRVVYSWAVFASK